MKRIKKWEEKKKNKKIKKRKICGKNDRMECMDRKKKSILVIWNIKIKYRKERKTRLINLIWSKKDRIKKWREKK